MKAVKLFITLSLISGGLLVDAALYSTRGGVCGGFRPGPVPTCQPELVCKTDPMIPDKPGVCVRPEPVISNEGGPCGGFMLNPPRCARKLQCKLDPTVPDKPGVCVVAKPPVSGKGGPCGGFYGLVCKYNSKIRDVPGVCVDPKDNCTPKPPPPPPSKY
ncbi:hypothetical protein BDF19DRAFT_442884 [Syncephalis fuscata]|nr:hypothetical protein BDF19DRAFT_442884 [Syncephalis fuscata]